MANIFYRQTSTPGTPAAVVSSSAIKGSPLTNAEADYNLHVINTELATKVSAADPNFTGIVRMNDLYLAGGRIKKYAFAYSGVIPTAGVLVGDYTRGNDGEKAIFDISVKLQKSNTTTLEGKGKIYFQATTGSAISVFHWSSDETNEVGQSVVFEVWTTVAGAIRIFCIPTGHTSYDHIAFEVVLVESGDFQKFTPQRTLTAKNVVGYTEILNTTQRLTSTGKIDVVQSGSYSFTGPGKRITGDLSNATHTDRLLFSSTTINGAAVLGVAPNGTGTLAGLKSYSSSDVANSSFQKIEINSSAMKLESGKLGSGTYKPMQIWLQGEEKIGISTDGVLNFKGNGGNVSYTGWFQLGGRGVRKVVQNNNIEIINNAGTTVTHTFGDNGQVTAGAGSFTSMTLGSALPIAQGGTGAATADAALTSLGGSTFGKALFGIANASAARTNLQTPVFENAVKTPAFFQSTILEPGFYTNDGAGLLNATGSATALAGWWHVLVFYHDTNGYAAQLAIELSAGNGSRMYLRVAEGTSWSDWSSIGGQRVVNGGSSAAVHVYAQANDCCVMWAGNNVYLPANPVPGDKVVVYKHGTSNCIVMRNGQNIMSLSENCTIDYNNSTLTFTYMESGIGWTIS